MKLKGLAYVINFQKSIFLRKLNTYKVYNYGEKDLKVLISIIKKAMCKYASARMIKIH